MKIFLIAALMGAVLFSGCITQKKVDRWNYEHPLEEARNCLEKYPCVVSGSDTTFIPGDTAAFNSAIEEMNDIIWRLAQMNDSLSQVIGNDSLCKQYEAALLAMQAKYQKLKKQTTEIKCRPDTIKITEQILDSALALQIGVNETLKRDLLKTEATGKVRLWMLIAAAATILLLLFLLFRKKTTR